MTKPWYVDDMVIHRLVDDEAGYTTVEKFLANLGPELLADNLDWFARDGYDAAAGTVLLSYHSYLVETPEHRVLIDTCIGNNKSINIRESWHGERGAHWLDALNGAGFAVTDVDYVLSTHLHVDHVGWNTRWVNGEWVPTFPNARHLIVNAEYEYTRDWLRLHDDNDPLGQVYNTSFKQSVVPVVEAGQVDLVEADHALGEYFRFIHTPGHTPGHVAIGAGRGRDVAVFTGDLIHSPIQARYPHVAMPFDADKPGAAATRTDFLRRFADTDTMLFTMHFPAPSAGYLKSRETGFQLEYVHP